ncbi:coiled-coil domain-containing protein 15 [Colossoma macropomum]|uniref:coiled-coil domain-containing protein 15 n=1 Tax=Colossoma macropomum TaxID=42526 RepID=UPI0018650EA6|nr:coiled-coil domain-containing protein 15 [Colossoma macropomum]
MSEQRLARRSEKSLKSRVKDGGKTLSSRKTREIKVLAERNPPVVPVGAWVETGAERQEHPAVLARLTEEVHEEVRREKEESLQRFQDAVRKRVSRQAQLHKQQQLQRSYEMAEREGRVVQQSSDAAQRLTPRKSLFPSWPQGELAICSLNTRSVTTQEFPSAETANQHTHQLSRVMKQVRLRLAACQTVREGEELSELPGGIWKVSPTRDKPVLRVRKVIEDEKEEDEDDQENQAGLGEEEEILLAGQHDRPFHSSKTVTFQNDAVCGGLVKEPHPTSTKSDYRSTQVLWPGEDEEELKRQRQSQFLMYRRLFMDIEREQVKEHQRQRKHLRRIARIKAEKERQRSEEESRMEHVRQQEESRREVAERERLILEQLRLEAEEYEEEVKRSERAKKVKENTRYIEALRAQMKEKLEQEKVELPPLCCCGDSFWDSHPDTCANNCVFYNNPKAYAQALHSVLLSCDLTEGSTSHRSTTWRIASMHAQSPRK